MKKIFALLLAVLIVSSFSVTALAAPVDEATIDTSRTGTLDIYKYDLTNAEKDGIWDSSYVSTGVKDANGVEAVLGDSTRVSILNANGNAYGYAIKGVEFTYVRVASIRTFTESEDGAEHIEVLYGIAPTEQNNAFLSAIGVSTNDRYSPADEVVDGMTVYYYRSDVLIDGLKAALDANATSVKNALEKYARDNHGVAMTETDDYGHTGASDLPLGLYLLIETRVPEMVTDTTAPFLVSLPMTSVDGNNANDGGARWIYDVTLYPKNLTGIPSLEKTLREDKNDTGKNGGSISDITDGYAHTATASAGDVIDYQIISTLPSITSAASYLTDYTFIDTLSKGITYNKGDVLLEFFKDESCTDLITSWAEPSDRFLVSYNSTAEGAGVMTISMTACGLAEINSSKAVYTGESMVNSGYSDCTLRITYKATMNSDNSVTYGDAGNPNDVVLTWKRSNTSCYDTLVDDCHVKAALSRRSRSHRPQFLRISQKAAIRSSVDQPHTGKRKSCLVCVVCICIIYICFHRPDRAADPFRFPCGQRSRSSTNTSGSLRCCINIILTARVSCPCLRMLCRRTLTLFLFPGASCTAANGAAKM